MSSNTIAHYFSFLKIEEWSPQQVDSFWKAATCSEDSKQVLNTVTLCEYAGQTESLSALQDYWGGCTGSLAKRMAVVR